MRRPSAVRPAAVWESLRASACLPEAESHEPLDYDILARLGHQAADVLADRLSLVFDEGLFEQDLEGLGLLGGDLHSQVTTELLKLRQPRDKIRFAVDLDERPDAPVVVDVGLDAAQFRGTPLTCFGRFEALALQVVDGLGFIAPAGFQGGLHIADRRAGFLAQVFDRLNGNTHRVRESARTQALDPAPRPWRRMRRRTTASPCRLGDGLPRCDPPRRGGWGGGTGWRRRFR